MDIQAPDPNDRLAYDIPGFCQAVGISQRHYHNLVKLGLAPPAARIGRRIVIRRSAAEQWLRDRESVQ